MFLDSELIKNTLVYETIKEVAHCTICTGILVEPQQCSSCDCCYCKKCLIDWQEKSKLCPFKCPNSTFKDSRLLKQMLSRLTFRCHNNCELILTYDEILTHDLICEKLKVECPTCSSIVNQSNIKINNYEKIIENLNKEIQDLKHRVSQLENNSNK